jgi:hypothetical protein
LRFWHKHFSKKSFWLMKEATVGWHSNEKGQSLKQTELDHQLRLFGDETRLWFRTKLGRSAIVTINNEQIWGNPKINLQWCFEILLWTMKMNLFWKLFHCQFDRNSLMTDSILRITAGHKWIQISFDRNRANKFRVPNSIRISEECGNYSWECRISHFGGRFLKNPMRTIPGHKIERVDSRRLCHFGRCMCIKLHRKYLAEL